MAVKKNAPKSQQHMSSKFSGLSTPRRMQMAIQAVLKDGMTQAESARHHGVDRTRLNQNLKAARLKMEELNNRSAVAAAERRGVEITADNVGDKLLAADKEGTLVQARRVPSFAEFDRMYMSSLECFDCGVHHETPNFHVEMMDRITDPTEKRLLINMPPGFAKSTIGTVKSTVYELCRDPNSITAIVSKSEKLASKFLYAIGRYLTDPDLYQNTPGNLILDWGPFQTPGTPWSAEKFYIAGRQSAEKDPSVSVYGVGGHIYGVRAHRIIMDDIADLENQANAERVASMLKWCTQEAGSRVGRHGKLIFIGTRVSAGDIYSHLQGLPGYTVMRYPCIIDDETETTLWPEHYAYEDALRQRDSMSAEQWQLVYQNVDTPGFGASFPPEVVEACYDPERSLGQFDRRWRLVAGLDPAGANSQAGYTALVLLGIDLESGKRYLIDMVNAKQLKAPQLRDQIFDWAERYPLTELRVESNGLQSQLVQYNQEIIGPLTSRGVRVVPHITTGRNKWDSEFGVESMSSMFINRHVSIPTKDVASRNRIRSLTDQLQAFPMGRTTDLVMAMWFAELGCRDIHMRSAVPMFDPRFKVPPRILRQRKVIDFAERRARAAGPNDQFHGRDLGNVAPVGDRRFVNVEGAVSVF